LASFCKGKQTLVQLSANQPIYSTLYDPVTKPHDYVMRVA